MKPAFLCALAIAGCLLAPTTHAQLQWLGPLPATTKPAITPKPTPPSSMKPATQVVKRAKRQIGNDDDVLLAKHKGLPLQLIIKDNQAKVCQLTRTLTNVCAVIQAPLPPNTTVQLWNLPDNSIALSYTRTPGILGAPDPEGKAAIRFQAAFNGAARAVLARTTPTANMACIEEDCAEIGSGGSGGGGSGSTGNGGSSSEPSNITVVEVRGTPDRDTDLPQITITGHRDPDIDFDPSLIPTLPPPDRQEALAGLTNPCVISPIATVCIVGKREPLPVDTPPLPTGNPPLFPQSMCDFAHIFCTRGQIPINPETLPPDARNPAWPKQHEFGQCIKEADGALEYCKSLEGKASNGQVSQCLDGVIDQYNDCYLLYGPNPGV